ncbi:MAG: hypothetical protein HYS80_02430 [Candidatus Aenigmarchaeota archaeon]|nr:hypothetical protein [Candidatus Aenigmarchaeota archaeon]
MRNSYKVIIFSIFSLLLFTQTTLALTSSGSTNKFNYKINETINYTGTTDQNITSNVTIYLINSSGTQFNFTSITPNSTNFTVQVDATVPRSGEYIVKANLTFNDTYFENSQIVKVSKAHSTVIGTNKPAYSPGEIINFTVRATDANNIGVSDESVTVRLLYSANDTALSSRSGATNSAGEYSGNFTAPNTIGSYRLTVNDWVATKVVDISVFDLVAFTGDVNGNIKTKFSTGDTVYVFMNLFDSNKTQYTGTESMSVQVTFPNGTQNSSTSYTFSGSRLNTSFVVNDIGVHNIKVTAVSTSKSVTLPIEVGKYELVGWLERNTTTTNFFTNEQANIRVKVFNVSSGEVIKTSLTETFELTLLDSSFANVSSISNTSTIDASTGIRTFTFTSPNTTGLYYVKIRLNQSEIILDMKITTTLASSTPVDQSYNFKNMFVGSKQTIRILTTLSNATASINVTSISAVSVKTVTGTDITSSLTFNTSIVDYKDGKAGLVEFSSPQNAGMYFIKTLANNNFATETVFLMKLYAACVQLDGYRWFISSNDNVNLIVKVSEAQDVGFIDSLAGNSSDSTNVAGSANFSSLYGMHDCYSAYTSTASGSSTSGNNTANIKVTVARVVNTLNGEDVTTKISNPPSNNTDDGGKATLTLTKPSGGWTGGTYIAELELRDDNNNTDKGFGTFQVKNLWINVWPKQISGRWKWYFSPNETMQFDVNAYNSTGTWYWYGEGNGIGDNCTVTDVFYQGNGVEWFWPPKSVASSKYTWSCKNSSAPANGRFNLNITPSSTFDTGYYLVKVKVNTSTGIEDVGDGWFSVKAYNVYVRTLSNNYYDSWYRGITENVTLTVDVTNASSTAWDCYWKQCPANERVTENLNATVKLIRYDEWKPKDFALDKYIIAFSNGTNQNVSATSINTTSGSVNLTLVPKGGQNNNSWETGYYSVAVTIDGPQGKETSTYWFEIRSFFANLQFVNSTDFKQSVSTYTSGQNITLNVSATNRPSWLSGSSYGVSLSDIPVNITKMRLSYWDQTTYQTRETPVTWLPNATTNPNPTINGMTTVNITPASNLTAGNWYSLEVTMTDSSGNNQTGWASFQIKDFTFSARTKNWQYEFTNAQNISLDVAVCRGETWWCEFGSNSYSGSNVNVTVTKLMKSDSWPYTAVSGWTANSSLLTSANNGQGIITIDPDSTLAGGYYTAELSARPVGGGSTITTNVWFRVKSFTLSVSTQGEYSMSGNVTLRISTGATATLSNAQITCGYWPEQTTYSLSDGTLSPNSTSLGSSDNLIMFSPSGRNWVGGSCNAIVSVTSGGETQTVSGINFNMKSFTLSASLTKSAYLKNESAILVVRSDAGQQFNISDINITFYNYENNTNVVLRMGQQLSTNATGITFTGNAISSITPTGNWSYKGWHYGQIRVVASNNPSISQTAWFSFDIRDIFYISGWSVLPNTTNYYSYNTSSGNITILISPEKYNATKTNDWWPYSAVANANVTITSIERESCPTYPCSFTTVTGWTADTATSVLQQGANGTTAYAFLNITRNSGWSSGLHVVNIRLITPDGETTTFNRKIAFWVNS